MIIGVFLLLSAAAVALTSALMILLLLFLMLLLLGRAVCWPDHLLVVQVCSFFVCLVVGCGCSAGMLLELISLKKGEELNIWLVKTLTKSRMLF